MSESPTTHHRCDVHVIVNPAYEQYHEQCFDSLKNEPINVHRIPAVHGNICVGRLQGFRTGTAEYMSFVDDDDYIIPGIFQKLINLLDAYPQASGAFCREIMQYDDGRRAPIGSVLKPDMPWWQAHRLIHHIVVYRRAQAIPYIERVHNHPDCRYHEALFTPALMMSEGHRFVALDEIGYVWRRPRQNSQTANIGHLFDPDPRYVSLITRGHRTTRRQPRSERLPPCIIDPTVELPTTT